MQRNKINIKFNISSGGCAGCTGCGYIWDTPFSCLGCGPPLYPTSVGCAGCGVAGCFACAGCNDCGTDLPPTAGQSGCNTCRACAGCNICSVPP
ncbi:MAG: hypothetical protein AABY32_02180 [Nanoarchaeota archaeon]